MYYVVLLEMDHDYNHIRIYNGRFYFNTYTIIIAPVCCHFSVVGGLRTSVTRIAMLTGVFILLLGPPKPDRLKDRGQTK